MDIDRFHFTLGGLPLQDDPFADSNNSHQALSSASDSFYSPTASPTTPRTYSAASASALDFSSPTQGSLNSNNNSFASAFASGSFGMTPPQTAASAYFPPQGIYPAPVQPALADVHFNHGLATPSAPITPARRLTPHGAFDFGEIMPMNMACHSSPLRDLTAEGLNTRGHVDTQFWHRTLAPATSPASVAPFDLLLRMASPSSSFSSGDFPFLDPTSSGSHHAMASPVSLVVNSPGSLYYSYTPPTNQSTLRSLASPRRRVATNSAQRKSTPLQAVAALGPKKDRRAIRKSQMVNGVEVPVEETPRHACNLSGCNKAYARPEHLIRHIKSNHAGDEVLCEFCGRSFNRVDNYHDHLALHGKPRDEGARLRVAYEPAALVRLAQIKLGQKGRRGKKLLRTPVAQRRGVSKQRSSGSLQ